MSKYIEERIAELDMEEKKIRKRKNAYILMLYKNRQVQRGISDMERKYMEEIAESHNVRLEDIYASKNKYVMPVKREICRFFKDKGYTLQRIAMLIGLDCHSSVVYLLKKCK